MEFGHLRLQRVSLKNQLAQLECISDVPIKELLYTVVTELHSNGLSIHTVEAGEHARITFRINLLRFPFNLRFWSKSKSSVEGEDDVTIMTQGHMESCKSFERASRMITAFIRRMVYLGREETERWNAVYFEVGDPPQDDSAATGTQLVERASPMQEKPANGIFCTSLTASETCTIRAATGAYLVATVHLKRLMPSWEEALLQAGRLFVILAASSSPVEGEGDGDIVLPRFKVVEAQWYAPPLPSSSSSSSCTVLTIGVTALNAAIGTRADIQLSLHYYKGGAKRKRNRRFGALDDVLWHTFVPRVENTLPHEGEHDTWTVFSTTIKKSGSSTDVMEGDRDRDSGSGNGNGSITSTTSCVKRPWWSGRVLEGTCLPSFNIQKQEACGDASPFAKWFEEACPLCSSKTCPFGLTVPEAFLPAARAYVQASEKGSRLLHVCESLKIPPAITEAIVQESMGSLRGFVPNEQAALNLIATFHDTARMEETLASEGKLQTSPALNAYLKMRLKTAQERLNELLFC